MTEAHFSLILTGSMSPLETFLTSSLVVSTVQWLSNQGLNLLFICFFAWVLYHFVNFVVERVIRRLVRSTRYNQMTDLDLKKRQNTLTSLVSTLLRTVILVSAGMMVIKQLFPNINYAPIFASAGIIGIALGFGAQSLIKDFLTGLFIITENQYRVGDVVDLDNGAAGTVERIGIRSTVLRDADGNVHYVPNGNIGHVTNKTMDFSKVNFILSVHPDTDLDLLAEVINDTGAKLAEDPKWSAKITEAPHFMNVGSFSQLGIDVTVVGVTQPSEQWRVTGELRRRLLTELVNHKIKLATAAPWQTANTPKKK